MLMIYSSQNGLFWNGVIIEHEQSQCLRMQHYQGEEKVYKQSHIRQKWVSFYFHLISQTSDFFTQDQGGLLQFLKLPSKPVNPVSLKIG